MADPARDPARSARSAIERMLRPRSIAIVGASPSPGSLGASLLANLERFAFARRHPSGERRPPGDQRAAMREFHIGLADGNRLRGDRHSARRYSRCRRRLRRARRRRRHHLRGGICRSRSRRRSAAGGARALGARPRHGDRGAELPRAHQLCGRHSADLQRLRAGAGGRTPKHRDRVAKRRHGDRAARRAACARYRDLVLDLHRQRGAQRGRGFPRPSDRRRIDPCSAADGGAVPSSAALPRAGAPRP